MSHTIIFITALLSVGFVACQSELASVFFINGFSSDLGVAASAWIDNSNAAVPKIKREYTIADGTTIHQAIFGKTFYTWQVLNGTATCIQTYYLDNTEFQVFQSMLNAPKKSVYAGAYVSDAGDMYVTKSTYFGQQQFVSVSYRDGVTPRTIRILLANIVDNNFNVLFYQALDSLPSGVQYIPSSCN